MDAIRILRSACERSESELRASAAGRLRPARLLRRRIVRLCNAKSGVQCGEWRVADAACWPARLLWRRIVRLCNAKSGVRYGERRVADAGCWPARLLRRRIVRLPNARSRAWRRGHMGRVRRYGAGQMRNCRSVLLDGAAWGCKYRRPRGRGGAAGAAVKRGLSGI